MTATATQFGIWTNRAGQANNVSQGGGAHGQVTDQSMGNADSRYVLPRWMRVAERSRSWHESLGYHYDWLTQYNRTPTIALNTADAHSFANGTPTLEFTGTDADGDDVTYEVQIAPTTNFDRDGLQDKYDESNCDADAPFETTGVLEVGQCFVSQGGAITSARFFVRQFNNLALSNATAKLYAVSGTPGTNAVPTGSALAISDTRYFGDVASAKQLVDLIFTGANQYVMTAGTTYFIVLQYDVTVSDNDGIYYGYDSSSPTHGGNLATLTGSTWTADSSKDLIFYVFSANYVASYIAYGSGGWTLDGDPVAGVTSIGQSFTPTRNARLTAARLWMLKSDGSATGFCRAKLWSHTGTYGTNGIPNTLLATSDDVSLAVIPAGVPHVPIDFFFTGANRYALLSGTHYVIQVEYTDGVPGHPLYVTPIHGGDSSSPPDGNWSEYNNTTASWQTDSTYDAAFVIYSDRDWLSSRDAGFANEINGGDTDPFNSGDKIGFTVQSADTLVAGTYYWRARARDPTGSNTWSDWATARSFIVATAKVLAVTQGSFSVSGQSVSLLLNKLLPVAQGAYALNGQPVALTHGRPMPITQGSYSLTGQSTGLLRSRMFPLTQGAFALTGKPVGLLRGLRIFPVAGSYSLTGQIVLLKQGKVIAITQGSYALSGIALAFLRTRIMPVAQGSFSLNGQSVLLERSRIMALTQGSYALSGQVVALLRGKLIALQQGSLVLSGQAVNLLRGRVIQIPNGSFILTGEVVRLLISHRIVVTQGSFSLIGESVGLIYTPIGSFILSANRGLFTLTGQATGLLAGHRLVVGEGAFALAGQNIALERGKQMIIEQGSYGMTGRSTALLRGSRLPAGQGAFNLIGQSVLMHRDARMLITHGAYVLAGNVPTFLLGRIMLLDQGLFVITGFALTKAIIGGRYQIFVEFPEALGAVIPVTFDPERFAVPVSELPIGPASYIIPIKL
jgi:hypothetical protein